MCSPRLWRKGEEGSGCSGADTTNQPPSQGADVPVSLRPWVCSAQCAAVPVRLGEHSCLVCHRELDVLLPDIDYVEIPVDWWNAEADKSLLIGVFKHGMYPAGLLGASV